MVTLKSYLLLLSICTYGILQVHCQWSFEAIPKHLSRCFSSRNVNEVCHIADRRCAMGRDIPNSTTTTTTPSTTSTTSSTSTTSEAPPIPPADGTEVSITFKAECLLDNGVCKGRYQIDSPFKISIRGGNSYNYQCDDIFTIPVGENSYSKGLRISTILWRMLSVQGLVSDLEEAQKWISCPNVRSDITYLVKYGAYPLSPQPLHYTCWCYNNSDSLCLDYLTKISYAAADCYGVLSPLCHQRLCENEFGFIYDHLDIRDDDHC